MENEVLRQLRERKSVRAFLDKPVPAEVEDALYEAAFQAPTACRQQLYTILKVSDSHKKRELAEVSCGQSFIGEAPLALMFLADCRRWRDTYAAAGITPRPLQVGDGMMAMWDAVIAAQNVVVAAHSLGLGSCYIGNVLQQCSRVRRLLELPEEVIPAVLLVLGYPTSQQEERPKAGRLGKEYLVMEDAYRPLPPEAHRALFQAGGYAPGLDFEAGAEKFYRLKYADGPIADILKGMAEYWAPFLKNGEGNHGQ